MSTIAISNQERGKAAHWGHKWDAKKESNRIRRENAKRAINATSTGCEGGHRTVPALVHSEISE